MTLSGVVKCRIVSARFAAPGKIAVVNKHTSDKVKKWDLIAALDKKNLQTGLDRELAEFEKTRADFEIFAGKYPNPTDQIDKYLKTEKQALLNISVKNVELAKASLDECNLFSPVDGIIIDDNSVIPGIYVTPASSEIKIIDSNSFYIEIEIDQKILLKFRDSNDAKNKIEGMEKEFSGKTSEVYSDAKKFYTQIKLTETDLLPGLIAEIKV